MRRWLTTWGYFIGAGILAIELTLVLLLTSITPGILWMIIPLVLLIVRGIGNYKRYKRWELEHGITTNTKGITD